MKASIAPSASLLVLLSLSSHVLADPNVVHVTIAKSYTGPALARRGLWQRANSFEESLYNNITGGSYMANVTVGSPGQQISLVIDTGSSDVFVLAATADQCTDPYLAQSDGPCVGGTFDPTKSSTFTDIIPGGFDISYQDNTGSAGDYFTDTFSIGGATIQKFQMGLALNLTTGIGIMGIGYSNGESVAAADQYPGLIDSLVAAKKINRKLYSLYLDDRETSTGSILFGGIDTKKFIGPLKILDVQPDSQSQVIDSFFVELSSISVTDDAGKTTSATPSSFSLAVVLDSGTTITYVPPTVYSTIVSQLNAVDDTANTGIVFIDCNYRTSKPNTYISFGFGGSGGPVINVPVSEVIRTLNGQYSGLPFANACSLGIKSAESGPYLLGDTFLRSAYVVYDLDNNQIGIAQTNFEASDSNIVEAEASATAIPSLTGVSSGATRVPSAHFSGTAPPAAATSSDFEPAPTLSSDFDSGATTSSDFEPPPPSSSDFDSGATTSTDSEPAPAATTSSDADPAAASSSDSDSAAASSSDSATAAETANPTETQSQTGAAGANATSGSGSAASASTTKKSGAVTPVPAFDTSSFVVLGVSVLFALAGGIGFLA